VKASTKMSTPVTRGELREELETLKAEMSTKAELAAAIAPLATKAELAAAIAPLATKAELEAKIALLATKVELELWGGALLARIHSSEQRLMTQLSAEMARQFGALQEWMTARFAAADEKYQTLPDRVNRLESAVFGPK
jgi:hypothetical protein